jgi:hypothetical protein
MNEADLNNTFKYDKVVINLSNHNCLTTDATKTSFYVNLVEPIKNVVYVKIIRSSILSTTAMRSAPLSYLRYDPVYISLNDYNRSVSYINNNGTFNYANYFDLIPYSYENFSDISYSQAAFDWSDPSVYILNPPEQTLKRLNVEFRDKAFNLFDTAVLTHFNLSICVYYIKNRV